MGDAQTESDTPHHDAEGGQKRTGRTAPALGALSQGAPCEVGHAAGAALGGGLPRRPGARAGRRHPAARPRGCACRLGERDCDSPQGGFSDLNVSLFIKIKPAH